MWSFLAFVFLGGREITMKVFFSFFFPLKLAALHTDLERHEEDKIITGF